MHHGWRVRNQDRTSHHGSFSSGVENAALCTTGRLAPRLRAIFSAIRAAHPYPMAGDTC